nr:hypothetical protein [Cytophagales bacterium]
MIRKISNIWIAAIFIIFIACGGENKNFIGMPLVVQVGHQNFPSTQTLQKEEILRGDPFHHHKVFILDTILLTTSNSGKHHFHTYNTKSLKYLGSMGVRGEGPEAWTMPHTTDGQYEVRESGIFLWIFDFMRGHLSKVDLTKTLNTEAEHPVITKKIKVDGRTFPFFRLFYISDEKIISDCWISEQDRVRIKSYNPLNGDFKKSELFPTMSNIHLLPAEIVNSLYTTTFTKHPTKNLFVQAMATFNRIDILDDNLVLQKSIVDGENWQDNFYDAKEIDPSTNFLKDKIDGYNGTAVTEDFIFALEMKKSRADETAVRRESFARVFDWVGNPICLLHFDNYLNSIGVDEREGFLYATDYANELVLRYNIKNLMETWKN